jgi:flagellar basal-body rod modification protein FlgD
MNALVSFRANGLGNLTVTHKQQQEVNAEITSTYRAKLAAMAKSAAATKTTTKEATTVTEAASKELGRDAFLQLLVLELQNQDPLEPVDNSDMIAQLAQFSSLEQMESLNNSFETLSGNVDQLNFISAQGLLGRYVEALNESGQPVTGKVESVYLDGSIVVLNVDGEIVPMSGVLSIANEAPESDSGDNSESNSQ